MHIDDLCQRSGYSRKWIRKLVERGIITGPKTRGRYATYPHRTLEELLAYKALLHCNTSMVEVAEILRSEHVSITEFTKRREASIRYHGLAGVA